MARRTQRVRDIDSEDQSFAPYNSHKHKIGGASASTAANWKLTSYCIHHLQAFFSSLGRIWQNPFSSLMTISVIGIALALPGGLHVILKNIQNISTGWENAAQISLFLKTGIAVQQAKKLQASLEAMPEISSVQYLSPDDALEEFRKLSGFGEALDALNENPLPTLLIVQPSTTFSAPAQVGNLVERLRGYDEVDLAQLDMEWIKRLYAFMEIGKRGVLVLAALLALAVLLIVGNTIRLAIQNKRDEIEVQKLIGATNAFIRRPFLYSGIWHGLLGAIIAWLLIAISLWMLNGPVQRLSLLYDSNFELGSLGGPASLTLLATGIILGLLGAWAAVGKHLQEIEPG
jgi:cell division transport system permease protein